ncbi:MAG: hypothetical protein DRG59_13415 [Deltaproteobacteria bacterium]|nr:MAG: hypothetical protein DRG59_13415 [Deltaproteobacteria bacterium]
MNKLRRLLHKTTKEELEVWQKFLNQNSRHLTPLLSPFSETTIKNENTSYCPINGKGKFCKK